ncbi:hypothetical protein I3J09_01525 [Streptomyces clavuligerus]|nr:hypothetical protein [Streptomyces clavuligerus]MBY6307888.1 hypothetical protein [Streptomyces clavuligerus]QPJ96205.1 hypothetical protein GE265_26235 [Streptomyces clavuligerus]QPL61659.1 hypothetical protein I3J04_01525 [Streptomyces clavuligerus]QPL67694.1 hypothetical protein I3J05_01540 [Streptomyces clavuligerus]
MRTRKRGRAYSAGVGWALRAPLRTVGVVSSRSRSPWRGGARRGSTSAGQVRRSTVVIPATTSSMWNGLVM